MSLRELEQYMAKVKALGTLNTRVTPRVARVVERFFLTNIAAARGPDGEAWEPRKEDGGKPLATAGRALRVVVVDATIFARLTGHIARHQNGTARGRVERPIFPREGVPSALARQITAEVAREFDATMKEG